MESYKLVIKQEDINTNWKKSKWMSKFSFRAAAKCSEELLPQLPIFMFFHFMILESGGTVDQWIAQSACSKKVAWFESEASTVCMLTVHQHACLGQLCVDGWSNTKK